MARRAKALMREAFEKWDDDGNGTISRDELAGVLKQLGDFKAKDVERIMVEVDRNGDGQIQYMEFVDWLMRPVVTAGAAALLSTAALLCRAESSTLGDPTAPEGGGEKRWTFGAGPLRLEKALPLPKEHTIAAWVLMEAMTEDWSQVCGDTRDGWGLSYGVSSGGHLGVQDPRLGNDPTARKVPRKTVDEPLDAEPGSWALLVFRGMCESAGPSTHGCTECLVANDARCLRLLGTVPCVGAGLVVGEFGSRSPGVAAVASFAVWPRLVSDEELRELFLWDAVRFSRLGEDEAAWLRLNRRRAPSRSDEESEVLAARLHAAASGKSSTGVLDVSNLKLVDDDLPRVLAAAEMAYTDVSALILSGNYLTEEGVKAHLVPFVRSLIGNFRIDLRENADINCDAGAPLVEAVAGLPASWGVSVDARGTGLTGEAMAKLLNQTPEAQMAVMVAAREQKRAQEQCELYVSKQAEIEARWAAEVDSGPGDGEVPDGPPFDKFPDGDVEKLKSVRKYLAKAGSDLYDIGERSAWDGLPNNCASGQLIAHFTYLCKEVELRDISDFTLRQWRGGEEAEGGAVMLHEAVAKSAVKIVSAVGISFGSRALALKLQNLSEEPVDLLVPAGTVFQHSSWVHLQNLIVGRGVHLALGPGQTQEWKLGGMCMNLSCGCCSGEKLKLTSFLLQDLHLLESQLKVWEHFEAIFARFREQAGFPDGAKKKKGKGGAKKKGGKKK